MRLCVLSSCCIKFNIFRSHQKSKQCHWQLDQPRSARAARCSQATSLESSLLVDPRDGRSGSSDQVVAAVLGRWSWGIRCLFGSVSTCFDPRRPTRRCEAFSETPYGASSKEMLARRETLPPGLEKRQSVHSRHKLDEGSINTN